MQASGTTPADVRIEASAGTFTIPSCGSLHVTNSSSNSQSDSYIKSSGAMTVTSSGAINIANTGSGTAYAQGASPSFTSGATITNNGGTVTADSGDIKLIADVDVKLQNSAILDADAASTQSIIIASDQASSALGIGHVDISADSVLTAGGTTTSSGKLRIFCGLFENNTISTSANLNGGTFSGQENIVDANNIYDVAYNAGNLPAGYGAPYTFYYEAEGHPSVIPEVERANILLTSVMVSSSTLSEEASYSLLARIKRGFFLNRGKPFKGQDLRKKRGT